IGHAVLEVADTGIGIDSETLQRLFQPFAQADRSLDRSRGGLGLGLVLVKGLVELHGGEIHAHSDGPGTGAYFRTKLPIVPAGAVSIHRPAPTRPAEPVVTPARRVLVIEDNRDTADGLREILELAGHTVSIAFDGREGLNRAKEFKPAVVLCDIGLPEIDGYGVARALRADTDPALASVFLVALTGYAQPEDQRRAQEAGFDQHLPKPPDLDAIDRILGECGAR
ncbi:MAG: response regulator, partial [Deltaproteobacteria bacterium]|nr:response regulator [Deltaproteobacteria bacterium]